MKNELIEQRLDVLEDKIDQIMERLRIGETREERIDRKIKGIYGHAVPVEKRHEKIEEVFVYKPIDREPIAIDPKDLELDMDDYRLWQMFNNPRERRQRQTDLHFTDNPALTDEERVEVHKRNTLKLKENLIKQIKQHPGLFGDSQ
jgi:hypothetical protein